MPVGKIFCTGLSRTGTTSLHLALVTLGFSAIHYPLRHGLQWLMGDCSEATTLGFQCFSDVPVGAFVRELDRAHPGARFIHTRRDPEAWLDSAERFFDSSPPPSQFTVARDYLRVATYGTPRFSRERFRDRFEEHEDRIAEQFGKDCDRLLVLDLDSGLSWEPLAAFLGVDVPADLPFPAIEQPRIGPYAQVSPGQVAAAAEDIRRALRAGVYPGTAPRDPE